MALNGSIVITTRVDSGQATKDLESLIGRVQKLEDAQNDAAKAAANQAEQTSKLASASNAAGIAMGVFGAAMAAAAIGSIKLAADLEQSRVAFTTLLGSGEKAKKFLDELAAFAASTPFEFKDLQDSSRRLLAFGFAAKDIIPIMNAVGSAVAGLGGGKEQIDRVTLALGQMQAKGKVSAEEMNQIAELGIPGWQMIASAIGKSIPEAMKLAEKGAIDSTTAINALINGMNAKFPGMLEKQSQTINGQLSNLRDGVTLTATLIGERLVSAFHIADAVGAAARAVSGFANIIKTGGLKEAIDAAFPPGLQATVVAIAGALTATLIPAIGDVAIKFGLAAAAAAPVLAIGAAIAASAYLIARNWEPISKFFEDLFNGIAEMAGNLRDLVAGAFGKMITAVRNAIKAVVDFVRPIIERLYNALPAPLRAGLDGVLNWTREKVGDITDNIGTGFTKVVANVGGGVKKVSSAVVNGLKAGAEMFVPELKKLVSGVPGVVANTVFTGLSGKAPAGAGGAAAGGAAGGAARAGAQQGPDLSGALRRREDERDQADRERREREEIQSAERIAAEKARIERETQQRTASGLREAYGVALNLLRGDFEGVATFFRGKLEDSLVNALSKSPAVQNAIAQLGSAFTGPLGIAALFGSLLVSAVISAGEEAKKVVNDVKAGAEAADRLLNPKKYEGENPRFRQLETAVKDAEKQAMAAEDAVVNFQKSPAFLLDAITGGKQMGELRTALGTARTTLTNLQAELNRTPRLLPGPAKPGTLGYEGATTVDREGETTIGGTVYVPDGKGGLIPKSQATQTKPAAMPGETPDRPIYTQVVNVRDFRDAFPDSAYFRAPSVDTTRSLNANAVAYR